ncbi:MAG: DUF4838 domain-containing protein [Clostridia bacterium]|nr:DUF4838 domain-containing protein [Clostridia bacterium]
MLFTSAKDSAYQIIYPSCPTESLKYAAEELKAYIFKISGAMLPYFQDSRHPQEKEIIVGYTNRGGYTEEEKAELGKEGFIIKTEGEKIYILGSEVRGALYGVYAFLEEYCNCRFYTNDFERVPRNTELEIADGIYNKQIPKFAYRNSYWKSVSDTGISAKLKINGCHGRERFPAKIGGDVNYAGGFEHTIGWLTEQCKYGERAWHQPCLTDEENYKKVIKNLRWLLSENPDATLVSITQNDGFIGACQCERCKAISDKEGSDMGVMLQFVNRVADELGPEYPNVMFDTFAYRTTRVPPKTLRPRDNVIVRLCSIECCFRHSVAECAVEPGHDDENDQSFAENLLEWSKIAPTLYVWNYTTNFTNFPVLFFTLEGLRKDVNFFATNNVTGLFEQGNYASLNGEFGELKGYIIARLLWDPLMSVEKYKELIVEFIRDFYGAGAQNIIDYLEMVYEGSRDSHFGIYFDDPTQYYFVRGLESDYAGKVEFLKRGKAYFDAAEAEATDDITLMNVRRSRIHLFDYEDFLLRQQREMADEADKAAFTEKIHANAAKRFDYMRKYDVTHNMEFHSLDTLSNPPLEQHSLLWKCPGEDGYIEA